MRAALLCIALGMTAPAAAQDVALGTPSLARAVAHVRWRDPSDAACASARHALEQSAPLRRRAHAVQLPRLRGAPTVERLDRWSRRELVPFLERALQDLASLHRATREVLTTGCYVEAIEALAHLGRGYEALVEAWAQLPEPSDVDPYLGLGQQRQLLLEPQRAVALDSYEAGLRVARLHRAFGASSQACGDGLVRLGALPADHELVSAHPWGLSVEALPPIDPGTPPPR